MSRKDVKELGDLLDEGQAALLIVGESVLETYIEKALSRATRHASLEVEMDKGVLKQAIAEAAKELETGTGLTAAAPARRPRRRSDGAGGGRGPPPRALRTAGRVVKSRATFPRLRRPGTLAAYSTGKKGGLRWQRYVATSRSKHRPPSLKPPGRTSSAPYATAGTTLRVTTWSASTPSRPA